MKRRLDITGVLVVMLARPLLFALADVRPSRSKGFAPSTENSAMGKIGGKKRQEGG